MTARIKAGFNLLVVVGGIWLLPGVPPVPSPAPPPVANLPVATPAIPSVLPSAAPANSSAPPNSSSAGGPAPAQPSAAPAGVQGGGVAQGTGAPATTTPAADDQSGPHRIAIPMTGIYVSSPLDVALLVALMALPLLLAIWLFLFLRTIDKARLARDAQTRLILAADLGLPPREVASMQTKTLFKLREQAAFDELTGVLRRVAGIGMAEQEVHRARQLKIPLTVVFVDVDDLKEMNDKKGRAAGDAMLRGLVQFLRAGLRPQDILIRYGGDEFVCVLPDTSARTARAGLGGIQTEAARVGIRFAIGVAELNRSDDVVSLFGRADRDLYEFKANRGEIVEFPAAEAKRRSDDRLSAN